jgi:pentatricopeptide repeat protein
VTYHTLMLGYCDKGCRDKALKLYSKRPDEGFPSNEASYLKLMKGYIKKKTVDKAYALNEMRQNGALDEDFKQTKSEGYNMEMVIAGDGCAFPHLEEVQLEQFLCIKLLKKQNLHLKLTLFLGVALSVCTLPEQVTSGSLGQGNWSLVLESMENLVLLC